MDPTSRQLVGFQWAGWWFVNNVLPFGWKTSPYIYQSLGLVATQTLRSSGVPCSQYIDDRHLGQLRRAISSRDVELCPTTLCSVQDDRVQLALNACYMAIRILTSLGYFLNLSKSVLVPTQSLIFLGLQCDSQLRAFSLPPPKLQKFAALRDTILQRREIPLVTLQRLMGKCISFMLVVPAAKLFTGEMSIAISKASKNKRPIRISGPLREEIMYWRFLDSWQGHMKWFDERHYTIHVASDSSSFRWGGVLLRDRTLAPIEVGDFWEPVMLSKSIEIKEIVALSRTLLALQENVQNFRVDAAVDNKILCDTWERQHSRSPPVLLALKELFWTTVELNLSLHLHFVPSHQNPADLPSRRLSLADSKLSSQLWAVIQTKFGGSRGHSFDLLASNSNAQRDLSGASLPFFSPTPSPYAAGVNVFAQHISSAEDSRFENCYAFLPSALIGSLINFLRQERAHCTLVVPDIFPRKYWWPIVQAECSDQLLLATRGQSGALLRPGKSGFVEFGPFHGIFMLFNSIMMVNSCYKGLTLPFLLASTICS